MAESFISRLQGFILPVVEALGFNTQERREANQIASFSNSFTSEEAKAVDLVEQSTLITVPQNELSLALEAAKEMARDAILAEIQSLRGTGDFNAFDTMAVDSIVERMSKPELADAAKGNTASIQNRAYEAMQNAEITESSFVNAGGFVITDQILGLLTGEVENVERGTEAAPLALPVNIVPTHGASAQVI